MKTALLLLCQRALSGERNIIFRPHIFHRSYKPFWRRIRPWRKFHNIFKRQPPQPRPQQYADWLGSTVLVNRETWAKYRYEIQGLKTKRDTILWHTTITSKHFYLPSIFNLIFRVPAKIWSRHIRHDDHKKYSLLYLSFMRLFFLKNSDYNTKTTSCFTTS